LASELHISIGLLWNEPVINGTLNGEYTAHCYTDTDRWLELEGMTGRMTAKNVNPERDASQWAIRLGECYSRDRAMHLLKRLKDSKLVTRAEIVEAGKRWETRLGYLDNRVWWPVLKLDGKDQAQEFMEELHQKFPIGLSVVSLTKPDLKPLFWLRLGNLGGNVVRVVLKPQNLDATITIKDVPSGRGFHWERREPLTYRGEIELIAAPNGGLTAINKLPLERYVETVVSSEMGHSLPPAFAQAQAIAARSAAMATANRHHFADGFDVCGDEHCQDYHGVIREADSVTEQVRETRGKLLMFIPEKETGLARRVVDARYSKSCGGVSDKFLDVWGEEEPGFFTVRACGSYHAPDLNDDYVSERFLYDSPRANCNPGYHTYPEPWDKEKLFRWTREYDPLRISGIFERKTGARIGLIKDLIAKKRSPSGKITILEVIGSEGTTTVYGELEIRRALSDTHLPSSFFVLKKLHGMFILRGGGWGHGVGMCQLGAVAMAKDGQTVEQILAHYYPNTALESL
jgi:stage II sporulation protein D